jgi:Na+/melibiose symporter-like transporter
VPIVGSQPTHTLGAYTGRVKPWVQYSLIRLGVFAVILAFLLVVSVPWYWAAIIAAVVGLCVSYIFFGKLRDAVALDVAERRVSKSVSTDDREEDLATGDHWPPGSARP